MNLVWKEFRESYPVIVLGVGVLFIMALWPALTLHPERYDFWGMSFHASGSAIMLFVALVVGVTTYALEIEEETLELLRARPMRESDITATKIGVRLGLLFLACLVVGGMEYMTGAWGYGTTTWPLIGYVRWLELVSLVLLGFAIGFYFGKTRGHQTRALLAAGLLFMAGYVILGLTPLTVVFQAPGGGIGASWIRSILLPLVASAGFLAAGLRTNERRRAILAPRLVAPAALGLYLLILWSLTAVPSLTMFQNPDRYGNYLSMAYGSEAAALDAYLDEAWRPRDLERVEFQYWMILGGTGLQSVWPEDTPRVMVSSVLRDPWYVDGVRPGPPSYRYRLRPFGNVETYLVERRGASFLQHALEMVASQAYSVTDRLLVLHAAGHAGDPILADPLAGWLEDREPTTRWMATMALIAMQDARGLEVLLSEMEEMLTYNATSAGLFRNFVYAAERMMGPEQVDRVSAILGALVEEVYQEERSGHAERPLSGPGRSAMYLTQRWIGRHGGPQHEDVARKAEWSVLTNAQQEVTSLAEIDLTAYYIDWEYDPVYSVVAQRARGLLHELLPISDEIVEMSGQELATGSVYSRRRMELFSRTRQLERDIRLLQSVGRPEGLDLFQDSRPMLDAMLAAQWRMSTLSTIGPLVGYGDEGLQVLRSVTDSPDAPVLARLQAALILIEQGERERIPFVLETYPRYAGGDQLPIQDPVKRAFVALLGQGHLPFAGVVIEEANRALGSETITLRGIPTYRIDGVGTGYWNELIVEALMRATGRDFGWDIDAWTAWWEREGRPSL